MSDSSNSSNSSDDSGYDSTGTEEEEPAQTPLQEWMDIHLLTQQIIGGPPEPPLFPAEPAQIPLPNLGGQAGPPTPTQMAHSPPNPDLAKLFDTKRRKITPTTPMERYFGNTKQSRKNSSRKNKKKPIPFKLKFELKPGEPNDPGLNKFQKPPGPGGPGSGSGSSGILAGGRRRKTRRRKRKKRTKKHRTKRRKKRKTRRRKKRKTRRRKKQN